MQIVHWKDNKNAFLETWKTLETGRFSALENSVEMSVQIMRQDRPMERQHAMHDVASSWAGSIINE